MDRICLGRRIRECRKHLKMTQTQLANRMGVTVAFISLIERGKSSISLENFVKLCAGLDVPPAYLLSDSLFDIEVMHELH